MSDAEASFLDLHLSISDGFVVAGVCDKRDGFDFGVVNFPFLDGDVPRSASCGVCVSRLRKLRKAFSKVYQRHFDIVSKYNVGLKTLLLQGLSEPEFYGDLVYKF